MPTKITFYGGMAELGGNQFLLEDNGIRILFDFGINFDRQGRYFTFPYSEKKHNSLAVMLELGLYPKFEGYEGIYRQDYLRRIDVEPQKKSLDAMVLSHAHLDHSAGIHYLRPDIDVWMDAHTKRILYNIEKTSGAPFADFIDFTYIGDYAPHQKQEGYIQAKGKSVTFPRNIKLFEPSSALSNNGDNKSNNKSFNIGHVKIEPFYVDHSMPGACGFIIHTSSGIVVYTGDLRLRGRRRDDTERFIKAARNYNPDYLLCEGSLIHKNQVGTEDDVVKYTFNLIKDKKGLVCVSYPPRDIDRIKSFYEIAKKSGRFLVINTRQAHLLELFDGEMGYPHLGNKYLKLFLPRKGAGALDTEMDEQFGERDYFKWERKYIKDNVRVTLQELKQNPDKYILFLGFASLDDLVELKPPEDSIFIRSHPEPYTEEMEIDEKILLNWLEKFNLSQKAQQMNKQMNIFDLYEEYNVPQIHVTGHMSLEETKWFINQIKPKKLVPIHTLYPDRFDKMYDGEIIYLKNGETLDI